MRPHERMGPGQPLVDTPFSSFCNHARTLTRRVRRLREKIVAAWAAAVLAVIGALMTGVLAIDALPARGEAAYCAGADLHPTASNGQRVIAATMCLINQVRRAYDLRPLRTNRELRRVAASQVHHMVSWNYFADDRPPGITPLTLLSRTRYSTNTTGISVGQNIGWGTGEYATPAGMVAAWIASPGHLENIVTSEYREVGVGVIPAVPARFEPALPGATYAMELATRSYD
jgi:Cysteine-rich secretory protein family